MNTSLPHIPFVTTYEYVTMINNESLINELSDIIDDMTNERKIILRETLASIGFKKIMKNLYYNYKTQAWI